jgi:DUF971 family protein
MKSASPESLVDHHASGVLEIRWRGGRTSRLPHALLRASCRCAACERQRRDGQAIDAPAAVRLAQILPVADQGVNLVFDDGHGRGIYPWSYLHEL